MAATQMVFGDKIVTATELNRRSGDVLNEAWDSCVTIVRNNQTFALLRRELASRMVAELSRIDAVAQVLGAAIRALRGEQIEPSNPFEWVTVFNSTDLKSMTDEVLTACNRARNGEISWEEFDSVLHEWQETAWAVRSPDLRVALMDEERRVPLTMPPSSDEPDARG